MSTKRILAIMLSLVMVMALFVGCGSSQDSSEDASNENGAEAPAGDVDEPIVLRLADNHNEGYPTVKGDRKFAELVEERTDGKIKIEVYPGGQLGDEKSVIEQVQFGAIDFTRTSISPLTEFNKDLSVLMLPYLYRDRDHMFKVLDGEVGDKFLKSLEDNDMLGLCWFDGGSRNFYNAKKEVKTVEDMKGLKIRVQQSKLMMDLVTAVGASPTPMTFGEVYSALQTGVIDGAENNWPSYLSTSHYEVAKYFTVDEHTRVPEMIVVSKMTYDKIPDEYKPIIEEAAKEAALYQREEWEKAAKEAEEKVVENGNVITRIDEEARKGFQDAVKPLYEEFGAGQEDIIEKILNTK